MATGQVPSDPATPGGTVRVLTDDPFVQMIRGELDRLSEAAGSPKLPLSVTINFVEDQIRNGLVQVEGDPSKRQVEGSVYICRDRITMARLLKRCELREQKKRILNDRESEEAEPTPSPIRPRRVSPVRLTRAESRRRGLQLSTHDLTGSVNIRPASEDEEADVRRADEPATGLVAKDSSESASEHSLHLSPARGVSGPSMTARTRGGAESSRSGRVGSIRGRRVAGMRVRGPHSDTSSDSDSTDQEFGDEFIPPPKPPPTYDEVMRQSQSQDVRRQSGFHWDYVEVPSYPPTFGRSGGQQSPRSRSPRPTTEMPTETRTPVRQERVLSTLSPPPVGSPEGSSGDTVCWNILEETVSGNRRPESVPGNGRPKSTSTSAGDHTPREPQRRGRPLTAVPSRPPRGRCGKGRGADRGGPGTPGVGRGVHQRSSSWAGPPGNVRNASPSPGPPSPEARRLTPEMETTAVIALIELYRSARWHVFSPQSRRESEMAIREDMYAKYMDTPDTHRIITRQWPEWVEAALRALDDGVGIEDLRSQVRPETGDTTTSQREGQEVNNLEGKTLACQSAEPIDVGTGGARPRTNVGLPASQTPRDVSPVRAPRRTPREENPEEMVLPSDGTKQADRLGTPGGFPAGSTGTSLGAEAGKSGPAPRENDVIDWVNSHWDEPIARQLEAQYGVRVNKPKPSEEEQGGAWGGVDPVQSEPVNTLSEWYKEETEVKQLAGGGPLDRTTVYKAEPQNPLQEPINVDLGHMTEFQQEVLEWGRDKAGLEQANDVLRTRLELEREESEARLARALDEIRQLRHSQTAAQERIDQEIKDGIKRGLELYHEGSQLHSLRSSRSGYGDNGSRTVASVTRSGSRERLELNASAEANLREAGQVHAVVTTSGDNFPSNDRGKNTNVSDLPRTRAEASVRREPQGLNTQQSHIADRLDHRECPVHERNYADPEVYGEAFERMYGRRFTSRQTAPVMLTGAGAGDPDYDPDDPRGDRRNDQNRDHITPRRHDSRREDAVSGRIGRRRILDEEEYARLNPQNIGNHGTAAVPRCTATSTPVSVWNGAAVAQQRYRTDAGQRANAATTTLTSGQTLPLVSSTTARSSPMGPHPSNPSARVQLERASMTANTQLGPTYRYDGYPPPGVSLGGANVMVPSNRAGHGSTNQAGTWDRQRYMSASGGRDRDGNDGYGGGGQPPRQPNRNWANDPVARQQFQDTLLESIRTINRPRDDVLSFSDVQKSLPKFGAPTTARTWESYISRVNKAIRDNDIPYHRWASLLYSKLEGEAEKCANTLSEEAQDDFEALCDALKKKFVKPRAREQAHCLMEKRYQKKGETIEQFATALCELALQAFPEDLEMRRDVILRRLNVGLGHYSARSRLKDYLTDQRRQGILRPPIEDIIDELSWHDPGVDPTGRPVEHEDSQFLLGNGETQTASEVHANPSSDANAYAVGGGNNSQGGGANRKRNNRKKGKNKSNDNSSGTGQQSGDQTQNQNNAAMNYNQPKANTGASSTSGQRSAGIDYEKLAVELMKRMGGTSVPATLAPEVSGVARPQVQPQNRKPAFRQNQNRTGAGTTGNRTTGRWGPCHRCGKHGHWRAQCTAPEGHSLCVDCWYVTPACLDTDGSYDQEPLDYPEN